MEFDLTFEEPGWRFDDTLENTYDESANIRRGVGELASEFEKDDNESTCLDSFPSCEPINVVWELFPA